MPLPAALAAKLAKRGLVSSPRISDRDKENGREPKVALCCPNKYNVFHECTTWCQIHWKIQGAPEPRYLKNIRKLLEKHPLPKNCTELFDGGVGRYYYWDMEKNLVSWLPPTHPRAVMTEPASRLRQRLNELAEQQELQSFRDGEKRRDKHKDRRDKDRDDDRRYKHDDRDRNRRRGKRDDLDPMDPASYSDIPRGVWSDGLESSKGKADSTASGALFQQRPYPSPGDVLEANKQKGNKKK